MGLVARKYVRTYHCTKIADDNIAKRSKMCNVVSFVDTVLSVVSCKAISYISKLLKYSLSSFHQKEFYQFYPHLHVSGYNENSSLRNLLPIPFFLNLRNNSDAKYHINFEKQLRYFFYFFYLLSITSGTMASTSHSPGGSNIIGEFSVKIPK